MPIPTTQERLGTPNRQPGGLFAVLRSLVIAALGVYVIYTAELPMRLPIGPTFRYIWGGLMLAYGLYRLWQVLPFNTRKSSYRDDDSLR